MILEAVAIVCFVAVLEAGYLWWILPWIVDRTIKQVLIQQRLLEHSARAGQGEPMPEGTTLADLDKGPGYTLVQNVEAALAENRKRSLRYTEEHRHNARRQRALEAQNAKIEAGQPAATSGIAVGEE